MRIDERLDAAIDAAARGMTSAAPSASLRRTVRERIESRPPSRGWLLWQPAMALAVFVLAVAVWPRLRPYEPALPAPAAAAVPAESGQLVAVAAPARPVAASEPRRQRRGSGGPARLPVSTTGTPSFVIEPLVVERLPEMHIVAVDELPSLAPLEIAALPPITPIGLE